jgi:hypothetical protein
MAEILLSAAALGAIAAGTQTATSGTVLFSNSNGITFGMSNSSVVTASFIAPGSASAGARGRRGAGASRRAVEGRTGPRRRRGARLVAVDAQEPPGAQKAAREEGGEASEGEEEGAEAVSCSSILSCSSKLWHDVCLVACWRRHA